MGLTKQYLRYTQSGICNIIASTWSNFVVIDKPGSRGPFCAVGSCENVTIWDLRKSEKHMVLSSEDVHQTTCVAKSPDGIHIAVGFKNGTIKIFNSSDNEVAITFVGHKSSVSCLNYDHNGMRLVSGGMDTDIVVWDVVTQSGLYRLKGHKGVVTQARFMKNKNILVTSSKDTFVKFWDLASQHCFKTLITGSQEVYDFTMARNDSVLITGSGDIIVWKVNFVNDEETATKKIKLDDDIHDVDVVEVVNYGSPDITRRGHILSMCQDTSGMYLGCHGTGRNIEIYKLYTEEESLKHFNKRMKKAKRKAGDEAPIVSTSKDVGDEFRNVGVYRLPYPLKTFQITSVESELIKIVAMFRNNTFGRFELRMKKKSEEENVVDSTVFSSHGHLKEPVDVSFSSDNFAFLSVSHESLKVWNRTSLQCFRTISCKLARCATYALADTAAVVGTQEGKIEVYEISSSDLVQSVEAHSKAVNVICQAGKTGLVSGGSDKHVIFWSMELKVGPNMLTASKRVKVADEVLCMSYSSDQRYLAIGCLDNKAYVFYADTMNMLHTLYYHHQPITCIDISTDSNFIVTGSGDKDIKIWSMQFGECLKIIKVAHEEKITSLQFIPKTHMIFSCGRDGKVKQWDCDNFQQIMTLEGHQGPVNSISVSPNGKMLVSASSDMSIRLWTKTDEILVLDEEREMAEEKAEEGNMRENIQVPGESGLEVGVAGKKTAETLFAVEKLCDALDLYKEEKEKELEHQRKCKLENKALPKPSVNLLFEALKVTTPEDYLLETLKNIRSSELHECLLVLPFSYVMRIMPILCNLTETKQEPELVSNCLFFLLRVHAGQIVSNNLFQPVLEHVNSTAIPQLKDLKDTMGYNLVGLKFLQQVMESSSSEIFKDAIKKNKTKKKSKKALLVIKS